MSANIKNFIQQSFRQRAEDAGALVVYDPRRRLRDVVLELNNERFTVIDASDSFIETQEKAIEWWSRAGSAGAQEKRLIVYVPLPAPMTDEAKCQDPFTAIASGSDAFLDEQGDSFQVLCERAKPDHRDKIRELFSNGLPSLATLEAVGGKNEWPQLQTLLGAESLTEILVALLAPSDEQRDRMKASESWLGEAKDLLGGQLGFNTKGKKRWEAINDDLWRFILFSEFAYDLPQALPASLDKVPLAPPSVAAVVNRVCETLRNDRTQGIYIERANAVAKEMQLEERMKGVEDLGELDTFAFEERSFLRHYVKQLLVGDLGAASQIALNRQQSVWVRQTDRGILWTIAERARELLVAADDIARDMPASAKSASDLISFYCTRAYRLDQAQRELQTALADAHWEVEGMEELIDTAGARHHAVTEAVQKRFVEAVVKDGWPATGATRATQIFDKVVAPLLEIRGKRIAYFMVDALRFELAVALERQLTTAYTCRLNPACAQLPTITAVGMAALLPKADGVLTLNRDGAELVPYLAGKPIRTPADRRNHVHTIYGDRVQLMDLDDVIKLVPSKKKGSPLDGVELLLIKTTDIDEQGEIGASNICRFLPQILRQLIAAVGKLKKMGFHHVVFTTDHGFALHTDNSPGNTVAKPSGDWLAVKDRCKLGSGSGGPDVLVVAKEHVGIAGDFVSYAVPRTFATFNKRPPYFHEGLSLQENVIPVLEVDLGGETIAEKGLEVQISYRGGLTDIVTTRRPVLDVAVFGEFLANDVAFRLEARGKKNGIEQVVGEAVSSQHVDPATGLVRLKAGQAVKVPLRLDEDFVGPFDVRAVDAETGVVYGSMLKLKSQAIA